MAWVGHHKVVEVRVTLCKLSVYAEIGYASVVVSAVIGIL